MIQKQFMMFALSCSMLFSGCAQQKQSMETTNRSSIAFPGAEGFGKYTTGGRGGKVMIVSNLNDDGPGSFRDAAEAKGKRMIVFAVSGTIHLASRLSIKGDVTIAGQTAPGDGICLADHPVGLSGDNIIVRYIRVRMGDKYQRQAGMVNGSGGDDAFSASGRKHIIIDHCSFSWSTDEVFSVYKGDSTTLQWNIITEPLNYSYHFETGDKDWENHGYGGIWGGSHLSAHHNLIAHCVSRTPRFNGARLGASEEFVDFRNNVIYNWQHNNVYGGEGGTYNVVNNYYKYGPVTNKNVRSRIVNPSKIENQPYGQFYVAGNYVDGDPDVTRNNLAGVHMDKKGTAEEQQTVVKTVAFPTDLIIAQTAEDAYKAILLQVGASFQRDTMDARIINDVQNRTGVIIDVQGHYPHHSAFDITTNAWPVLKSLSAPVDTDKDGMPDEWEKKNGLNANDATDASENKLHQHYTNIEVYINSLIK
jgi:hypothetical protein